MAYLSKEDFNSKWFARFAPNFNGEIDEPDMREFTRDAVDSFYNKNDAPVGDAVALYTQTFSAGSPIELKYLPTVIPIYSPNGIFKIKVYTPDGAYKPIYTLDGKNLTISAPENWTKAEVDYWVGTLNTSTPQDPFTIIEINAAGNGHPTVRLLSQHQTNMYLLGQLGTSTPGNITPSPPGVAADDNANTLAFTHNLGVSQILVSVNDGAFVALTAVPGYDAATQKILVGNVAQPPGYWKAKIQSTNNGRNESSIVSSPAFTLTLDPAPAAGTITVNDQLNLYDFTPAPGAPQSFDDYEYQIILS